MPLSGSSESRHLLSKGPGSPFPHHPGDGRSIDYTRHVLSRGHCRFNASHHRMRLHRPIACRFAGSVNRPPDSQGTRAPASLRRPHHPSLRQMHRDAGYLPRQRSGQVPLPEGSAPHNLDHSRQHVGIIQTGADGLATTPGLDSSHRPSIAYPLPLTNQPKPSFPPQLNTLLPEKV